MSGRKYRFFPLLAITLLLLKTAPMAHAIVVPDTLPSGVRALGFVTANANNVNSTLNANGYTESLVRPLNRSVSFQDFAIREPRLQKLQGVLESMGEPGLADSLLFANLYSSISIQDRRTVGALFWGITDRISIGVVIPKIVRDVNVDFRADVHNGASDLRNRLGDIPQLAEGLDELSRTPIDTATFEEAIFTSKGYLPPRPFQASGMGDIELEIRALTFQNRWLDIGLRGTMRAPTATYKPDLRNVFDRELGDGSWGAKLGSIHALKLVPDVLTFHTGVFGTLHAKSHPVVALPVNPLDDLADLNDPNQIEQVTKKLGSQFDLDAGVELSLWKRVLNLSGAYQYSAKARDQISGSRGLDYGRLMLGTDAIAHSLEWGVELSSVPLFLKKSFPLPGKLSLLFHQALGGKNSVLANYGRIDAILFF